VGTTGEKGGTSPKVEKGEDFPFTTGGAKSHDFCTAGEQGRGGTTQRGGKYLHIINGNSIKGEVFNKWATYRGGVEAGSVPSKPAPSSRKTVNPRCGRRKRELSSPGKKPKNRGGESGRGGGGGSGRNRIREAKGKGEHGGKRKKGRNARKGPPTREENHLCSGRLL